MTPPRTSIYDPADETAVSPALAAWLRARVLVLRQTGKRARFLERIELASVAPADPRVPALASRTGVEQADDHALRVELLSLLLTSLEGPQGGPASTSGLGGSAGPAVAVVHVRPGPPEWSDSDIAWAAAARCQAGMTPFAVRRSFALTRWGWLDLTSGEQRTWVRLRR